MKSTFYPQIILFGIKQEKVKNSLLTFPESVLEIKWHLSRKGEVSALHSPFGTSKQ